MRFIVNVSTQNPVPYEVEADSPEEARRIVAEFVEQSGVALGDAPVVGQNPWPRDAPMYEYDIEAFDDQTAEAMLRAEHSPTSGPVQ